MKDQMGCLLGEKIAERLNKKVGDRLVLRSTIWSQKNGSSIWEFNVRADVHNGLADLRPDDDALPLQNASTKRGSSARVTRGSISWASTTRAVPPRSPRPSIPASPTAPTKRAP